MTKREKQALARAFAAPAPRRKRAFLRTLPAPRPSGWAFMWVQARYIRRRVWLLSFGVFAAALGLSASVRRDLVWSLAALIPFIALAAVTETTRSEAHGMAELEAAARFSLKSVLLARMGIVGAAHLLTLAALTPLACQYGAHSYVQAGVWLLTPYLLTTALGLAVTRRLRGRESLYASACITAAVSIGCFWAGSLPRLMEAVPPAGWALLVVFLLAQTLRQSYCIVWETERMAWSL